MYMLNETAIFVLPVVNYDGYLKISDSYTNNNKTLINISKNLNIYESQLGKCENVGVDLNSNYGFNFASDDIGSSSDPCNDHYRGPNAFSEPETTAIKGFLEKWTNIKIAINLQSFGNFFIHPFNYDNGPNTLLHQTYPTADKFY